MKQVKIILSAFVLMLVAVLTTSCNFCSGAVSSSNFSYSQGDLTPKPFKTIEVDVVADVYYTQNDGDKCDVRLDYSSIDDADLAQQMKEKVRVAYRDGGVVIGVQGKLTGANNMKQGKRLKIYITSPDIVAITMEGIGTFNTENINTDTLKIDNEGVGSVNIGKLLANKVTLDNEGVGSVRVKEMQVDALKVDNEGVGSVHIGNHKGKTVKIINEGVGNVTAKVDCESVDANLEGVGSIKLSGVTRQFSHSKDGVGSIKSSDLKVIRTR